MADDPLRKAGSASSLGATGRFAGVGLQFAISILLFLYVGQWLDERFGTKPLFLYLGVFTGAGAAFYSMYRSLMANERREAEQKRLDREKGSK